MTTTVQNQITSSFHEQRASCEVVDFSMVGLVLSGLASVMAIMAVLYCAPAIGLTRIDVVMLAGTMFTPDYLPAIMTGIILWVGIGMLFAVLYVTLWTHGHTRPNLKGGLLLGLIHGNIVVALVPLIVAAHPVVHGAIVPIGVAITLVLGHLLFGVVMAAVYSQFAEEPAAHNA